MRAKYWIAAALLGLPGLATAADIVMRLGNDVAPASIQAQANELFAAEVAKRDVGIEIKVFHTNQLGTGVQQIQNVKLGVQEMVNTGYELFDVFASGLKIGSAPFTFVDRAHFENWVRSPMFDQIQQDLIKNGNMRFINMGVIWRRGPYRVMIAKHPILNLDELSKAKLRVWEAEPVKRFWGKSGLGATVVVLPLADVYLGLRQGVVDAINMPMDLVVPMKFAEVGEHIMNTREYPQFVAIAMNENSWQSLNDAQRQAILEGVDVAGQFYNDQIAGSLETWQKQIVEMGATIHDVDRQPFIDKMRELHKKWEAEGYWQEGTIDKLNALAK
jgi:TRAP-type C4-dicarboxylate transport system substrate-binding protein